jgi:hypothetical protein
MSFSRQSSSSTQGLVSNSQELVGGDKEYVDNGMN